MKLKTIKRYSFAMASVMFLTNAMPLLTFAVPTKDSLGSLDMNDNGDTVGVDFTQGQTTHYHEEITNEVTENTTVYVSQASSFGVIIPKTIILDGKTKNATYEVSVTGNIGGQESIEVVPEDSFLMKQQGKNDIDAIVTQDKTSWIYNEFNTKGNGTIVAEDMTAGSWNGQFNFNIFLNEAEPMVVAIDETGNDLNADATFILGFQKDTLLNELVNSGQIASKSEVSTLINVDTDDFENKATATFNVSSFANVGDKIAIYHYNETNNTWEYIATCEVNDEYKITANFDSFSPVAFQVIGSEHTHTHKLVQTTATCENGGIGIYECVCGDKYEISIDALGHSFNTKEVSETYLASASDCENSATYYFKCDRCDAKGSETYVNGSENGHQFSDWNTTIEPTCTTKGSEERSCSVCGKVETQDKDALGHKDTNDDAICDICNNSAAGLYDANGVMLCSWEDSGIDIEMDYTYSNYDTTTTSSCYVLQNKYPTTTKIILPNNITTIGIYAFRGCKGLTNIIISNSIINIKERAFFACPDLTNITIPNNVTNIGTAAFQDCINLETITLPNNITDIKYGTFENCTSLTNITIPNSITSIGDKAFYNCTSLTNITIPDNVTNIGSSSFYNCLGFTNIFIPKNVIEIGSNPFGSCINLETIIVDENNENYNSKNNCNAIIKTSNNELISGCKNTIISKNITIIGSGAFTGYTNLTNIEIPSNITTIKNHAFNNCTGLTNITIPNSVTSIGEFAFRNCTNLTNIEIPDTVTKIESGVFYNCKNLSDIVLSNNITEIYSYSFYGCTNLTNIKIPSNITSIGDYAFSDCINLISINIPYGVTIIGKQAFAGCRKATSINIPSSVTYIKSEAFCYCDNYKLKITIPSQVKTIEKNAFLYVNHITYYGAATGSPWGADSIN